MKAVLQRVQEASVSINGDIVSHISKGFLILLGIEAQDGEEQARILANKPRLYGYLKMKTES